MLSAQECDFYLIAIAMTSCDESLAGIDGHSNRTSNTNGKMSLLSFGAASGLASERPEMSG